MLVAISATICRCNLSAAAMTCCALGSLLTTVANWRSALDSTLLADVMCCAGGCDVVPGIGRRPVAAAAAIVNAPTNGMAGSVTAMRRRAADRERVGNATTSATGSPSG